MAGRGRRVRGRLLGGLLMAGVMMVGAAACQRDSAPAGATGPLSTPDGPGAIAGRIEFVGTPPSRPELRVSSDPNCVMNGDTILSEAVVVGREGGLQNVFVYISDGLGDRRYEVPSEPVVLDQVGCRYIPHVFGVQVGQPVQIINSDPTLHNVHATTRGANFFNFTQMAGQGASIRDFKEPEVMVPLRCDVHGWMIAYAGVLTHPYYAVTDEDGRFAIRGLPPGTYTVEAWHERLGVQTATVEITEGEPEAALAFSFEMQG